MRRLLLLAAFMMTLGCGDDLTGPELGRFNATLRGARTLDLAGTTYSTLVYAEVWPTGRYSISMSAPQGDEGRVIIIQCPDTAAMQVRTYTLGSSDQGCRGFYHVILPPDLVVRDEVISTEGTMTVTAVSATSIVGTFQFTGGLRSGFQPIGPVTVSGSFNSTRYQ